MPSIADLETPPKCTADFCLIPLGTPTASVSQQIADVQRLLKESGLKYSMHSAGTTVGMSTMLRRRRPATLQHTSILCIYRTISCYDDLDERADLLP